MNPRISAIVLAIGAFSFTVGISLWQQRRAQDLPAITGTTARTSQPVSRQEAGAGMMSAARTAQPAGPAGATAAGVHPAEPPDPELKIQPFSEKPVPVFVVLGPAASPPGQVATLRNPSARPMDVSITASNPTTGHQASAEASLAPFADVVIDEARLIVQKGDVLTLHSPPFADRQVDTADDSAF
jgi:hypothetical protein